MLFAMAVILSVDKIREKLDVVDIYIDKHNKSGKCDIDGKWYIIPNLKYTLFELIKTM